MDYNIYNQQLFKVENYQGSVNAEEKVDEFCGQVQEVLRLLEIKIPKVEIIKQENIAKQYD